MTIDPIERTHLTLSAGAVAASLVFASPAFALSLLVGSAIETVNFRGLRRSAQFVFDGEIASGGVWSGVFALRFLLLATGIAAALHFGAHPVGLVVGLSLVVPAVVIEAWRARPAIDPTAPTLSEDDPDWDRWNPWLAREAQPDDEEEGA